MKNFKKDYSQPFFSVIATSNLDVIMASNDNGEGNYNINWLADEEEGI